MTEKIYHFDVPVSGRETFSVRASSYEEAVSKINNGDFEVEPETIDVEWDFGLGHSAEEYLPRAYTLQSIKDEAND